MGLQGGVESKLKDILWAFTVDVRFRRNTPVFSAKDLSWSLAAGQHDRHAFVARVKNLSPLEGVMRPDRELNWIVSAVVALVGIRVRKQINISVTPFILSTTPKTSSEGPRANRMPPFMQRGPHRPSQDQQSSVDPQNSSKPPARHGSTSRHESRAPGRKGTGNNGAGESRDADGERRSRNRSNSTPPDNRQHHHHDHRHRPRNGQAVLIPVSANESWAWGQNWVNTWWGPGRAQIQVQTQVQVVVRGGEPRDTQGQREGDRRGRGRRSSDAKPPPSTPAPAPRRMPTPAPADSPPVIPGVTTTSGMGLRNLLRKKSPNRPKILFYDKDDPHYGFTNFSPHPVMYRRKRYPTSEHLFQSFKVCGEDVLVPFCFC